MELVIPRHLCRGVYGFCSFCSYVRSYFLLSHRTKFYVKSFSSGVYLTNHSSESIHIWTIGTLAGQLSFHGSMPQSGARGQNLRHL